MPTREQEKPTGQRRKRPALPFTFKLIRKTFQVSGKFLPKLTARAAYWLWFKTQRYPVPGREKKALETARCDFITVNEHHIARYRWGENGGTILLVHGWNGRGTQFSPFIEPLLEAGYQVLSFDAPSHGRSDGHATSGMEIIQVMHRLSKLHGPFEAVITHSFGGLCGAAALVQGLVAAQAVFIAPPGNLLGLLHKFSDALWLSYEVTQLMKSLGEQQFGDDIWESTSTISNAHQLSMPGLVIHDDQDRDVSWQEGAAVALAWPGAKFIKTSGLGHRRILRDRETIEGVITFMRQARRVSASSRQEMTA